MSLPPTSQEPIGNSSNTKTSLQASQKEENPIPRWLPISLLALTTAALAVPIVLLRRQRANALSKTLSNAPPPPRRGTSNSNVTSVVPPIRHSVPSSPGPSVSHPPSPVSPSRPIDDFNGALYSAKAFGIATLLVTVGATTTIWGVKTAMGVQDTREFAHHMRQAVLTRMSLLSSRIHRSPNPEDHGLDSDSPPLNLQVGTEEDEVPWSWPAAEERLKAAFERDGFSGWAEAVMRELEAEGRVERLKRNHA